MTIKGECVSSSQVANAIVSGKFNAVGYGELWVPMTEQIRQSSGQRDMKYLWSHIV